MIWTYVALAFLLPLAVGTLSSPGRPPRHTRPRGWVGPSERAPFPPLADPEEGYGVWPFLAAGDRKGADLSPLNREVLRRRLRVELNEALGRPVV